MIDFCKKYLGNVKNVTKLSGGLMHKMFKVETDKGTFCVKVLNPEVMTRVTALNNFIVSESISNLAKSNNIPVSNALTINNNFINKYEDDYIMVFDYVEGIVLKDNEITIDNCKLIGNILSMIHSLDYSNLNLEKRNKKYVVHDFENYINNPNFNNMKYKDLYLNNYKKYKSILSRAIERNYDDSTAICHNDMDPKNVMWNNNNPIIIDWECASLSNPYKELLEVALNWSGFLSNNFDENKFKAIFSEYLKNSTTNVEWYDIICSNLIGRFNWLKYNLDRSLGIITNDQEEIELATNEVTKTIDEINRYLDLIGTMYSIIEKLNTKEEKNYDKYMDTLVENNELLKNKKYDLCTSGFTNTIYMTDEYVIRICTYEKNETRFSNEIDFYNQNKENIYIPKLYYSDITKNIIPYYYEIIEKLSGDTLYDIWYKIDEEKRKKIIFKIIDVVRSFHSIKTEEYDFNKYIKDKIIDILQKANLENEFNNLLELCDKYFKDNKFGLIHGDLHFDNFIYDGNNLRLIDFEYSMSAPIDYDFRIFSLYEEYPHLWASADTDMKTIKEDYQELMNIIIDNYEELKDIKYIKERLTIYQIIELLNNYKNTKDNEKLEIVKEKIRGLK